MKSNLFFALPVLFVVVGCSSSNDPQSDGASSALYTPSCITDKSVVQIECELTGDHGWTAKVTGSKSSLKSNPASHQLCSASNEVSSALGISLSRHSDGEDSAYVNLGYSKNVDLSDLVNDGSLEVTLVTGNDRGDHKVGTLQFLDTDGKVRVKANVEGKYDSDDRVTAATTYKFDGEFDCKASFGSDN